MTMTTFEAIDWNGGRPGPGTRCKHCLQRHQGECPMTNEVQGEAGDARGGAEAWLDAEMAREALDSIVYHGGDARSHEVLQAFIEQAVADHSTVALAVDALREAKEALNDGLNETQAVTSGAATDWYWMAQRRRKAMLEALDALARIEAARGEATR